MLQDIDTAADAAAWLASRNQPQQQQQQQLPQLQPGVPTGLRQPDGVQVDVSKQHLLQQEMAALLESCINKSLVIG
jgi:hypothetical protein